MLRLLWHWMKLGLNNQRQRDPAQRFLSHEGLPYLNVTAMHAVFVVGRLATGRNLKSTTKSQLQREGQMAMPIFGHFVLNAIEARVTMISNPTAERDSHKLRLWFPTLRSG